MFVRSKSSVKSNWFILNAKLTAILSFLVLVAIISLITHQRYRIIKENRERDISVMLESVELRLDQLLKNTQNIALTIAFTIDKDGQPYNFEEVAAEVIKANPFLQTVQLAPNGVITRTYPLKGNEEAIGLNLFQESSENKMAAEKAIRLREMYFQGPIQLVQGGVGVIGRLPLYGRQKFWGFSAVVIKFEELLKIAGINNDHKYYKFQFSKINPVTGKEEFFIPGNRNYRNYTFKTKTFEEGDWKIYLTDTRFIYTDYQLGSLMLFGIILSVLTSYLLLRLLNKQAQLYALVDAQGDQLIAAENKYKTIFDNAAIGIGRINSETGEFLEANAFLCNLFGYSAQELNRKKIKSLIHTDDLAGETKNFKSLMANEIRQFSSVRRYLNKNKEIIWANAIVSPLWEVGEKPTNHIVIIDDITQQVAYETALIASKKHTEELINSIEGIVWEASIKDGFANTFVSSKVYEILGYTSHQWTTESNFHFEHIFDEDKPGFADYIANELYTKRHHVYEYRMIAKDGSVIWIRDSMTIEPSLEAPEKLRGIMIDITSIKDAEDVLQKSFDLVTEQNKRLLNFSYIVSHNLRSHASNIDGITSLVSNAETDAERQEMIGLLKKVVVNLNDTLYNLNNIVNIQTSINLDREALSLHQYVNKAIHTQEAQILSKEAKLLNEVPEDAFVYFNTAYLESVLLNLISNALRYSHPERKPHIVITCVQNDYGWILRIKDNGVGIDLAKNGEKLFGLNQTFHGNSDARGFGLFITRNQIEAMGNRIEVDSVLGVGTTFTIFFK